MKSSDTLLLELYQKVGEILAEQLEENHLELLSAFVRNGHNLTVRATIMFKQTAEGNILSKVSGAASSDPHKFESDPFIADAQEGLWEE